MYHDSLLIPNASKKKRKEKENKQTKSPNLKSLITIGKVLPSLMD